MVEHNAPLRTLRAVGSYDAHGFGHRFADRIGV
jgi:hypothetical protein